MNSTLWPISFTFQLARRACWVTRFINRTRLTFTETPQLSITLALEKTYLIYCLKITKIRSKTLKSVVTGRQWWLHRQVRLTSLEYFFLIYSHQPRTVCLSDDYSFDSKSQIELFDDLTHIEPTLTPDSPLLPTVAPPPVANEPSLPWCDRCRRTFLNQTDFQAHLDRVHKSTSIRCSRCDKSFASRKTLSRHKYACLTFSILKHYYSAICQSKQKTSPKKRITCPHCDSTFSKKSNLNDHIRRKHTEKSQVQMHKCDKCSKQFTRWNIKSIDIEKPLF